MRDAVGLLGAGRQRLLAQDGLFPSLAGSGYLVGVELRGAADGDDVNRDIVQHAVHVGAGAGTDTSGHFGRDRLVDVHDVAHL